MVNKHELISKPPAVSESTAVNQFLLLMFLFPEYSSDPSNSGTHSRQPVLSFDCSFPCEDGDAEFSRGVRKSSHITMTLRLPVTVNCGTVDLDSFPSEPFWTRSLI